MATHSGIFAWEIPWTEELGRLQSKGLQGVGHDLATKQQQQPAFKSDDAEASPSDCAPRMSTWKPCPLQTLPLPLLQHERVG